MEIKEIVASENKDLIIEILCTELKRCKKRIESLEMDIEIERERNLTVIRNA